MLDGESLDLAEGSGALVFELGVEEIAAADGGDVEACDGTRCQYVIPLSLFFLCLSGLIPRGVSCEGDGGGVSGAASIVCRIRFGGGIVDLDVPVIVRI